MVRHNFLYGLRYLTKNAGLWAAITVTFALGIGTIAVALSVVSGVVLCRIPYLQPDRLLAVFSRFPESTEETGASSYPDFEDFRRSSRTLERLAATSTAPLNLTGGQEPERVVTNFVSANYFDVLGTTAEVGRTFLKEEDQSPKGRAVAILSHGLWQRRFGADRRALGRSILVNDIPCVVVGVLPASFRDLTPGQATDIWVPVTLASAVFGDDYTKNRRGRWLHAVGRLRPGVRPEQARAELTTIAQQLAEKYPDTNRGIGVVVRPLKSYLLRFNNLSRSVSILSFAALLVLLVSCVNIVNLLLVQVTSRAPEVAIRASLGSDRRHLVTQMLVEGLLLTLPGGIFGGLLALWGTRALAALAPIALPGFMSVELDTRATLTALAITLAIGIGLGTLLAWRLDRLPLFETLRAGARTVSAAHGAKVRSILIVGEVAAALMLVVATGILVRDLRLFESIGVGFRTDHLLTAQIELGKTYASEASKRAFYRRLLDVAGSLPGVATAGLWGPGQPGSSWWYREIRVEDRDPSRPDSRVRVFRHCIMPGDLERLGIRMVNGREFTAADQAGTPLVALVSQTMAKTLWPGQDPIGKRFLRVSVPNDPWITVVGVAFDAKHRGRQAENDNPTDLYLPLLQDPVQSLTLFLRTRERPEGLIDLLRTKIQALAPDLPVFNLATMEQNLALEANESRFYVWLLSIFSAIALALAGIGLYGLVAYSVTQRSVEIAIRMAIGAEPSHIYRLIGRKIVLLVLGGTALGLLGASWSIRVLSSIVHDTKGANQASFILGSLFLIAVALVAAYLPVRRAAQIDPSTILHEK